MIAPIDDRIRTFHKGLFTSDLFGYEDPTYLGFSLHFDFDPVHRDMDTGQSKNALWADPGIGIESAQEYLRNLGFIEKAEGLYQFREMMRYMNKYAPYFFQGITGVAELWNTERKAFGFNTEKKSDLKFSCLESVDLRMTAMADLYKNFTFDDDNMRELLPENLQWFTMTLRIAEIRRFHKIREAIVSSELTTSDILDQDILALADDLISVIEFNLEKCTFDFENSFADEFKMSGDTDMATQSFTIKVGNVAKRRSTYKLLNMVVDTYYSSKNEIVEGSLILGGKFSAPSEGAERNVLNDVPLGSKVPGYDSAINSSSLFSGAVSALTSQASSLAQQIGAFPGQQIAGFQNTAQSMLTGAALGNVNDIRNQSLTETINQFLSGADQLGFGGLGSAFDKKAKAEDITNIGNAHAGDGKKSGAIQTEVDKLGIKLGDVHPNNPSPATVTVTTNDLGNIN